MNKTAFTIAAIALLATSATGQGKTRDCNDCRKYDKVVRGKAVNPQRMLPIGYTYTNFTRLDGNNVLVEFNAVIPEGYVQSKEAFVFTPVVISGEEQINLPQIAYCGKKYFRAKEKSGFEENVTCILCNETDTPVIYQQVVEMVDDEKSAILMVGQGRKCVCEQIGSYGEVTLDSVADGMFPMGYLLPRFDIQAILDRNAATLFYIPAPYIDSDGQECFYDGGCHVFKDGLIRSRLDKHIGFITLERAKEILGGNCLAQWINNAICAAVEQGELEQAQQLSQCLGENDITPVIASNLMVLNMLTGDYDAARTCHSLAMRDPGVEYNYALLLLRTGEKNQAKEILRYFYK